MRDAAASSSDFSALDKKHRPFTLKDFSDLDNHAVDSDDDDADAGALLEVEDSPAAGDSD